MSVNNKQALLRAWRMLGGNENDDILEIHALIASRIFRLTEKVAAADKLADYIDRGSNITLDKLVAAYRKAGE